MSRREKLLARVRNNPRGVAYDELARLLEWHGFELKRVRGSHHAFRRGPHVIIVARRTPHVHVRAVQQVLSMIDELSREE